MKPVTKQRVTIAGQEHELELTPPRVEQLGGLIALPAFRPGLCRGFLRGELNQTADVDDLPIWNRLDDKLIDQPGALAPVWQARRQLYEWLVEQGRIQAVCPACDERTEIDLAFYVLALRLPPWRLFDERLMLEPLSLSTPEPPMPPSYLPQPEELPIALRGIAPRPPGLTRAARLELELPSARAGLSEDDDVVRGVMIDVTPEAERAAWRRFAPPHDEQPEERHWWSFEDIMFRAVLRLSVALERLERADGSTVDSTPETLERSFLADLYFLDLVYQATHDLPVPADPGRAAIACRCGQRFVPVR